MKAYFLLFFSLLFLTCEKNNLESLTPFEQNKRKWEALEVYSYTYSFQISCFCVFEFSRVVSVYIFIIALLFTSMVSVLLIQKTKR